jgi:hypothetical protein
VNNLQDYYNQIISWNTKAGVKDHEFSTLDWERAVELQSKLLVEEATETVDAMAVGNMKELLDGAVDTFVILSKLFDMLEKAGFDVERGIQQIIDNNQNKIFNSFYEACEAKEKLEERDDVEYYIETSVLNNISFYTVRRPDGKIAKPVGFVAVELDNFIPKEVR